MRPLFSIAVLAGGESSRLGRNKALELLGGKPVIAHVIDSLAPLTEDIFIAARDAAAYECFGLPVRADHYPHQASLVGIYSAVASAQHDLCLTVACDMPFTEPALVDYLAGMVPGHEAVVPVSQRGREPLHAIYSRACLGRMRERIESGDYAISGVLAGLDVRYVELQEMLPFCDPNMNFLNVNTVVELEEASLLVPRLRKQRERESLVERTASGPPLICFVGWKDSGKTTFLERLLPELRCRGLEVACIKHDAHGFTMDREGTDTWRLSRAGAKKVAISAPGQAAFLEDRDAEMSLDDLYAAVSGGVDLVIAEGFKDAAADKLEVRRVAGRGDGAPGPACPEDELLAVISDRADEAADVPVFGFDDVEAVVNLIFIRYSLDRGGRIREARA